jgi:hypothetical protein
MKNLNRRQLRRLIESAINEIQYDGYNIEPNEDGTISIADKNYELHHPAFGRVNVIKIRTDDGLVYVKAKLPNTPDFTSTEKALKPDQITAVKKAVLANKSEFEVSSEEGAFKFKQV